MDRAPQADAPDEVVQDLVDVLARCAAFSGVDRRRLGTLVRGASLVYVAAGQGVPELDAPLVVQRGALLIRDGEERTTDVVSEGEYHHPTADGSAKALEGALILLLPESAPDLAWSAPSITQLTATAPATQQIDLQTTAVRKLMTADLVSAKDDERCRDVAALMTDRRVSSVIILGRDEPGIVTDRDLRSRLVAAGRSADDLVGTIATFPVRSMPASTTAFDALIEMLSRGIHHLPLAEDGQLVGMVTSSDLLQLQMHSPLHLRKSLDRAESVEACAAALTTLPDTVRALRAAGTTPSQVTAVLATVADRCAARLITLAIDQLGPAPAPYGWIAFGSQARGEGTLTSDQDSGLVFADGLDTAQQEWFARLGAWVTDGLARCGYPRCNGGVMASEVAWRADVTGWRHRVEDWITAPTERHLMHVDIALDLRTVAGEIDAVEVTEPIVRQIPSRGIFLARLATQAVAHRPPLGFLGRVTVDRTGADAGTFDLKRGALMPIVDIARLHTLATGGQEIATAERLAAATEAGVMSRDLADTLMAGHELALGIRLDSQLERLATGQEPSTRVDPSTLPALVRSQLKETFSAVRTAQESIRSSYQLVGG